jgi:hypothetical protein
MNESDPSTLWRLSAFREARNAGRLGAAFADRPTLLPTTLLADLRRLENDRAQGDVLEVVAACIRNHEAALLYVELDAFVWPLTLFPRHALYHSPRDALDLAAGSALSGLRVLGVEPPGVRPPGDAMNERVASPERYRPLPGLLWAVAMHGPRAALLTEIGGRAAYRLAPSGRHELPPARGAIASAMTRLEREPASLREIATWPGMSVDRASRLLNTLYLSGALMVSRTHPAASPQPKGWRAWFGGRR